MKFKRRKFNSYKRERVIQMCGQTFKLILTQNYEANYEQEHLCVRLVEKEDVGDWRAMLSWDYHAFPDVRSEVIKVAHHLYHLCGECVYRMDIDNFIIEEYLAQGVRYTIEHLDGFH